mmetsp:Transcript_41785/g.75211  ORF Transcript_41785/g.75211 Transcript_41785/m.75211 type:complete len:469 (+) Transcript_41785:939-2345(+)
MEEVSVHPPLGNLVVLLADIRNANEGWNEVRTGGGIGQHHGHSILVILTHGFLVTLRTRRNGQISRGLEKAIDTADSHQRRPLHGHIQIVIIAADQIGMRRLRRWVELAHIHILIRQIRRRQHQILHPLLHKSTLQIMTHIGSLGIGRDHHLHGTRPFLHLDICVAILLHHGIHFPPAMGQHGIHPIRPNSGNGLADQHLDACGNKASGAHGIDFLQIPLQVGRRRLLLRDPRTGFGRMGGRRLGLPKNSSGPPRTHSVQRKQHTATIMITRILIKLRPHTPLIPIGPALTPHGQTIVDQAGMRCFFVLGHVLFGKEGGIFFSPSGGVDEAGGDDSGIVAAFEGVGLFAGAGVAVEIFLQRPRVLKPIFNLLRRSVIHQLLTSFQVHHQILHVRRRIFLGVGKTATVAVAAAVIGSGGSISILGGGGHAEIGRIDIGEGRGGSGIVVHVMVRFGKGGSGGVEQGRGRD